MATSVANILTKGQLSEDLDQWIFISFGAFAIVTLIKGITHSICNIASIALHLITGWDCRDLAGMVLLGEASLSSCCLSSPHGGGQHPQQPIVIHTISSDGRHSSLVLSSFLRSIFLLSTLLQLAFSNTFLWLPNIVITQNLPKKSLPYCPLCVSSLTQLWSILAMASCTCAKLSASQWPSWASSRRDWCSMSKCVVKCWEWRRMWGEWQGIWNSWTR